MKKKILSILTFLALTTFIVAPVLAQVPGDLTGTPNSGINNVSDIYTRVKTIIQWVYTLFLALAVLFIILAAISYLTAGGDPAKVKKANGKLIYAIVAIVVAILAFSLKSIIVNFIS
jgi:hypothetical protein